MVLGQGSGGSSPSSNRNEHLTVATPMCNVRGCGVLDEDHCDANVKNNVDYSMLLLSPCDEVDNL
eukprot:2703292-Ditylum_brightwellii.AAC.1